MSEQAKAAYTDRERAHLEGMADAQVVVLRDIVYRAFGWVAGSTFWSAVHNEVRAGVLRDLEESWERGHFAGYMQRDFGAQAQTASWMTTLLSGSLVVSGVGGSEPKSESP
jgi:hypothetical protein